MRRSTAALMALLLLVSSSLAVAYGEESSRSEEEVETRRMFREWMAENEKTYRSIDEEEHRYALFKENRRRHLGLNLFADLTDEELRSLHTGCAVPEYSLLDWINILLRWGLGFPAGRG